MSFELQHQVTECRAVAPYRFWVRFGDGVEGTVDLSHLRGVGVFRAWEQPGVFEQARVDTDAGTVVWPGDIDIDPYVLRHRVTGEPLLGSGQASSEAA